MSLLSATTGLLKFIQAAAVSHFGRSDSKDGQSSNLAARSSRVRARRAGYRHTGPRQPSAFSALRYQLPHHCSAATDSGVASCKCVYIVGRAAERYLI